MGANENAKIGAASGIIPKRPSAWKILRLGAIEIALFGLALSAVAAFIRGTWEWIVGGALGWALVAFHIVHI